MYIIGCKNRKGMATINFISVILALPEKMSLRAN